MCAHVLFVFDIFFRYGMLNHMNGTVSFPAPDDCSIIDIYREFDELKEFILFSGYTVPYSDMLKLKIWK